MKNTYKVVLVMMLVMACMLQEMQYISVAEGEKNECAVLCARSCKESPQKIGR